jgi:hypothetical protein
MSSVTLLHIGHYWFVPQPIESHRWFGAIFLFLGVLLLVESLAGGVWFANKLRSSIWPAGAVFLGEGLVMVSFLDPQDRLIHLTVGMLLVAAGWLEMQQRFGNVSLARADFVVIPALLGSGFEMGVIHGRGSLEGAIGHMVLGATAAVMAGVRVYQLKEPRSAGRHALTGVLVLFMAVILLGIHP